MNAHGAAGELAGLIDFWFGQNPDDAATAREKASLWWEKQPETDGLIRAKFEPLLKRAAAGDLSSWGSMPRGALGLILLFDQVPRCVYRDSPDAFRFDPRALDVCLVGLESGRHGVLRPIERVFFYLPLEHSESLEHQEQCVELFRALANEVPASMRDTFDYFSGFAEKHHAIIARFGRFPHRNEALGRVSTPEETEFLQQPGSSF